MVCAALCVCRWEDGGAFGSFASFVVEDESGLAPAGACLRKMDGLGRRDAYVRLTVRRLDEDIKGGK